MRRTSRFGTGVGTVLAALPAVGMLAGCDPISVAPTCPGELRVGETIGLLANPTNPGAIPSYQWMVLPSSAGIFANARAENTTFQALREGQIIIRLAASDGLYQDVESCVVTVAGVVGLAVSLTADPAAAHVGDLVTLTCTSVGEAELTELSITKLEGPEVVLTEVSEGVATFAAPTQLGDISFRCVGADATGELSETALVTVRVSPVPSDNDNGNTNGNDNDNANANDNGNANDNDNANGNGNANSNDNGNSNANDNTNGNANANANGNANANLNANVNQNTNDNA
ncbi:MAG TPA: hypothetical protein PKK06_10245 [Phycisphaerae bacterium]|nr:hypothetical protein [Phycisphaerae bacterium]HNU45743.1 hypothetical protein [Phycisphaerae bacterium]